MLNCKIARQINEIKQTMKSDVLTISGENQSFLSGELWSLVLKKNTFGGEF